MKPIIGEGTWFAVPLRSKGFTAGVVARTSPGGGVILAYLFGKIWDRPPAMDDVKGLKAKDAIRVMRVGDRGIVAGTWPVLGNDADWNRGEWTASPFVRRDDLTRKAWIVMYSEHDANRVESETPTSYDTNIERDAVLGAGAAEVILTRLLR